MRYAIFFLFILLSSCSSTNNNINYKQKYLISDYIIVGKAKKVGDIGIVSKNGSITDAYLFDINLNRSEEIIRVASIFNCPYEANGEENYIILIEKVEYSFFKKSLIDRGADYLVKSCSVIEDNSFGYL